MIGIFIPYRNRNEHLEILLAKLSKYPNISVHVLEQNNNELFNRGKLFNIGMKELAHKYSYLIFHDVDLIPQDEDYNYIPEIPTHYSCFCEQFNYELFDVSKTEYAKSKMFGGVVGIKKSDFLKCNGYSNLYEGWGCEDNDLFDRIDKCIGMYARNPWTYKSLTHDPTYTSELNPNLFNNLNYLKLEKNNFQLDGINKLIKTKNNTFMSYLEYTFETVISNINWHKINFTSYYKKSDIVTIYINELKQSTIKIIIDFAYNDKKSVLITSSILAIPPDLKYFYCKDNKSYILKTYKYDIDKSIKSWLCHPTQTVENTSLSISTVNNQVSYLINWSDLELVIYNNYNYLSINYCEQNIVQHAKFDKYIYQTNKFITLLYNTPIISKVNLTSDDLNIINIRTQKSFNYYIYYILNDDLAQSIGLIEQNLTEHYISRGMYESRFVCGDIPGDFNPYDYYQLNVDLKFTNLNIINLTKHYITNGKNEKREYVIKSSYRINNIDWDYFKYLYPDIKDIEESNLTNYWLNNQLEVKTPLIKYTLTHEQKYPIIKTKTLVLTHPGGGGVEKYLKTLFGIISEYICLKPNCDKPNIYEININCEDIKYFYEHQLDDIVNYILMYKIDKIIINHYMIFSPQFFQMCVQIKKKFNCKIYTIIHDFSFFSEKANLTCDEIINISNTLCNPYYVTRYSFFKNVDKVIFPSEYIKNIYLSLNSTISVDLTITSFHPDIDKIKPVINTNISNFPEFKIVILGSSKGNEQIKNFVDKYSNPNVKIILVGKNDIVDKSIQTFISEYNDSDVESILEQIKPNLVWFPSKIPETYCYALSHPIKLGYPIVGYNIGAFSERLSFRPFTWLLELDEKFEDKIDSIIMEFKLTDEEIVSCFNYVKYYSNLICTLKEYQEYFV